MDLGPVLSPLNDLGTFIRDQRTSAQISLRALAVKAGVSNPYLSQVERGLRRPSADILAQIARGLSISVESLLAKAGVLDAPGDPAGGVEAAIRADEVLSERQKASLLEVYRALRAQAVAEAAVAATDPVADPGVGEPLIAGGVKDLAEEGADLPDHRIPSVPGSSDDEVPTDLRRPTDSAEPTERAG
ncbi:helix-turn-helix domain-containing protein [Nakamurella sp. YIM 132087]|uniref:Helix-turn-helix domain-containing protein n=1 Tax=Nakamurella alba TaxID=2665158 RepID=A0A7K1FKD5_9ACTN|nr:helix-turn-helix domain-containing protein [Nakamurella alba]MTD14546.1 helix-turn-helix domain-containing protein [Nakamurella alba]